MKKFVFVLVIIAQVTFAYAQQSDAINDVVSNIINRMSEKLSPEEVDSLNGESVLAFLSSGERMILGTKFLTFRVNVPSIIYLATAPGQFAPFWLTEQGFLKTAMTLKTNRDGEFEIWQKKIPAGEVGLGVNTVLGGVNHYVIFLKSERKKKLKITDIFPAEHQVVLADTGISIYVDRKSIIKELPEILFKSQMIKTLRANRNVGQLFGHLYNTRYPSISAPDQILLTWEADPRTTQTVTWRTDTTVSQAFLAFQLKDDDRAFATDKPMVKKAITTRMITRDIVNDKIINRHSVTLSDLAPNMTYIYSVGDSIFNNWSEVYEFETAPDRAESFSFMYIGDPQNGLDQWGMLMQNACNLRPEIAFVLVAGDLVNRGAKRDDWDEFFDNASVFAVSKPLVPVIGNHDCQGGHPTLYLQLFHLPTNGPENLEPERAYSFEYGNALFIILDSVRDPMKQADWLDKQLAESNATWKFVSFHYPIYSSSPNRDHRDIRDAWVPIFDKHHVDMVLQGHDHAYLRTYPMKENQVVDSSQDGTIYVVSVSGTKMYPQGDFDYIEKGFTKTATFQILDIQVTEKRLVYRSYDQDGNIKDEFFIEK